MTHTDVIVKAISKLKGERINWDDYFMSMACLASSRSPCNRLNVGCVIVKDTRVISMGYNGFLSGAPHESIIVDDHEQATVHAEQNAIADAAKRGVSINEGIAYITHYPCINCYKMLCAAGIKSIKYHDDYRNDANVQRLFAHSDVSIEKY